MIIPIHGLRRWVTWLMGWIYALAVWCDDFLLIHVKGFTVDVEGLKVQYPEPFYIIIANHQSWNDILILQHLFNRKAPLLKFLVKRELIFLPVIGLICWAYDYPFLRRNSLKGRKTDNRQSHKDTTTLIRSLHSFVSYRASIINLVEGTRYSPDKARIQNSQYRYLLKPKAGGLTAILDMLHDQVNMNTIIDVTIVYHCKDPTFWNLLNGKCKKASVLIKEYAIADIAPDYTFKAIDAWVQQIWEKKDQVIHMIKQDSSVSD